MALVRIVENVLSAESEFTAAIIVGYWDTPDKCDSAVNVLH